MVDLNTTWNTVVMLLVAGGVGLIGGFGAGLLEMRRIAAATTEKLGTTPPCPRESKWAGFLSSVVLGGIAAVAILYFFPPVQEVVTPGAGGESVVTTSYDLTKLVALALIVGSAGTGFLQVMQTRTLALASADRAKGAQEAGVTALKGVPAVVGEHAESKVKESLTTELVKAGFSPKKADKVSGEIASETGDSLKESLAPYVENAQEMVVAAGPGDPSQLA